MRQFYCHKCAWIGTASDAKAARSEHDSDRPACDGTPVPLDNTN